MAVSPAAVDGVEARAYRVPTPSPEADGTLDWDSTTIVVAQVQAGGITGLGWTYADAACVPLIEGVLAETVRGTSVLDVPGCWSAMQRAVRNLGRPGLVSCALSAVDIALWDAAARLVELPVTRLLGRVHESVAVYGSGGFTTFNADQLRAQLHDWVHDRGIPRVKIKIGENWGREVERDFERVGLTRRVVGDDVEVYVDANGGYRVGQARRVARRLEDCGVTWFEEPVSSDDLSGLAELRAASAPDITAGEYGYDLAYFAHMINADAVDCLQVDVTRCGGYTEWARIAAVAAAANRDVSAHCAPNLSAHAGAATANVRHLEWFTDHDRIENLFFEGTLDPTGGTVTPEMTAPGHGLSFKKHTAERYAC
jgi:L-alanine-DL-glutamate epimerase-like enolase superfamily enzyme